MIDHKVVIGGVDCSNEVKSIKCQQNILTDSDPGKITINLVNRHQMYTNRWSPQANEIQVTLYNYTYKNEPKEFPLFSGHITDLNTNHVGAIVSGECYLGHLADALPKEYDEINVTPKEALLKIMSWHIDYPITIVWDPALDKNNHPVERITYRTAESYQDVVEDISNKVGAVYYTNEQEGFIEFRSPYSTKPEIDLDPYVMDPAQALSIVGFCNWVVVVGDYSEERYGLGVSISGSVPVIGEAMDLDSISDVGVLAAPTYFDSDIKNEKDAKKRAEDLLAAYKLNKNAETKVQVAGMAPVLQSIVSYSPFGPISASELALAKAAAADRLKEMQAIEDQAAADQGRDPIKLQLSGRIKGVVVEKEVDYSIDGFEAVLTISKGMLEPGVPVTDDDIMPTNWDPAEES